MDEIHNIDHNLIEDMQRLLNPTISKNKSNIHIHKIYNAIRYPKSFLKEYVKYVKFNKTYMNAETATRTMIAAYEYITNEFDSVIKIEEENVAPQIMDELIKTYEDSVPELSKEIIRLKKAGKTVFEFPRHQSGGRINDKEYYDFSKFAEESDYIILFHGTSDTHKNSIKTRGLLPPALSGIDYMKMYEHLNTKYEDREMHSDEERGKTEDFLKSIIEERTDSVYFTTGIYSGYRNYNMYLSNDPFGYADRSIDHFGGNMILYACLVPTHRIKADEDCINADTGIDSLCIKGTAKINGTLKNYIYEMPDALFQYHLYESFDTLIKLTDRYDEQHGFLKIYLEQHEMSEIVDKVCL